MRVLRDQLAEAGFITSGQLIQELQSGQRNYLDVLIQYEPDVIIYDLGEPYQEQWNFFELLSSSELSTPLVFVLTSTDKVHLEQVVGKNGSLQFADEPGDLASLVAELRRVVITAENRPPLQDYRDVVVVVRIDEERSN
jgi:FixJ family two-component response regulator